MEETSGDKKLEIGNKVPSSGNTKKHLHGYNGIVNVCGMIRNIMIHSRNTMEHNDTFVEHHGTKGLILEQSYFMLKHKKTFFGVECYCKNISERSSKDLRTANHSGSF